MIGLADYRHTPPTAGCWAAAEPAPDCSPCSNASRSRQDSLAVFIHEATALGSMRNHSWAALSRPGNPSPLPQDWIGHNGLQGITYAVFSVHNGMLGKCDTARNEDPNLALSERQLLDSLSRMPFVDSAELALMLGEPHATVHRALAGLLAERIVGRVSHGTAHLPSSQRYYLTANGIGESALVLGFEAPSDFVRAYPVSREWLTLLVRRMDAVASIYRLAASMSPGIDGLRSHVEFHRRGRFDATITLHDGRSFGVVRQGLALRRRSLYDRLRAIAEYDYTRRPDTILILTPSVWEERLTTRFCIQLNLDDCFVAVETRDALERTGPSPLAQILVGRQLVPHAGGRERPRQPRPGWRSPPHHRSGSEHRCPAPSEWRRLRRPFGVSPAEKRTLDLIADYPMIPREHLALWLGVSEGRVSQMMRSLVDTWNLIERHGKRGNVRYTLSAEGITLRHPPGTAPSFPPRRAYGAQPSAPTDRAAGDTWATASRRGRFRRSTPTASHGSSRSWRPRLGPTPTASWCGPSPPPGPTGPTTGEIRPSLPTLWGQMTAEGLRIPFYFEHELRARHPQGVIARLSPYTSYYWSPEHKEDQPPYPVTLFVVDTVEVEDTYVRTAARLSRMSLPIFVSCIPALSNTGILGPSWHPLWEPESPRRALSELRFYQWDSLYHRMRHRPVEGR